MRNGVSISRSIRFFAMLCMTGFWLTSTAEVQANAYRVMTPEEAAVSGGGTREPDPWFHDVLHPDGRPYDFGETEFARLLYRDKQLLVLTQLQCNHL